MFTVLAMDKNPHHPGCRLSDATEPPDLTSKLKAFDDVFRPLMAAVSSIRLLVVASAPP
jgi:hypothetical protein